MAKKQSKKMGRPFIAPETRKRNPITIWLDDATMAAIELEKMPRRTIRKMIEDRFKPKTST